MKRPKRWTSNQRTELLALIFAAGAAAAVAAAAPLDDSGWEPLYPNQPRNVAVSSNTPLPPASGGAFNPTPGSSISRASTPVAAVSPNTANIPPALPAGFPAPPVGAPVGAPIGAPLAAPLGPPVATGVPVGPPPGYPPLTLPPMTAAAPAHRRHEIFDRQPTAGGPSMLNLTAPASASPAGAVAAAPSAGMMSWFTTPAPASAPPGGAIVSPWNNRSSPPGSSLSSSGPVWGGSAPTPGAVPSASFRVGTEAGAPVVLVGGTAAPVETVTAPIGVAAEPVETAAQPGGGLPPGRLVTLTPTAYQGQPSIFGGGTTVYRSAPAVVGGWSPVAPAPQFGTIPQGGIPVGPPIAGRPIPVGPPVLVSTSPALPPGQYVGRGLFGQPKVFVQGQPVRNGLRRLTP